jgi:hypothetical protein
VSEYTETEAPPPGEELHLPGPSVIPVLNAIVGLTLGLAIIIGGLVLFLVTAVIWIRDTVRDIDELPLDHGH